METKFDPADLLVRKSRIVGVVASRADWEVVTQADSSELDLCELRMDLLITEQIEPHEYLKPLPFPRILTIRDPREGGKDGLSETERVNLFTELLPHVDYIDIELRNFGLYADVVAAARTSAQQLIVSVHDFEKTPAVEQMERWANETEARSPDAILKISVQLSRWEEMVRLGNFLVDQSRIRVAAMGMGPLGKISRLLFARLGSELTYAACGEAVVPGQWDFRTLHSILSQIVEGS
ncbi:MAG TPA: type I 3-dehydroquinate dehydratase [Chthoniobacterales bacterium]|nr:type I 3-dehydroquinate dehydratase [Chthoniobacterales bacterium]